MKLIAISIIFLLISFHAIQSTETYFKHANYRDRYDIQNLNYDESGNSVKNLKARLNNLQKGQNYSFMELSNKVKAAEQLYTMNKLEHQLQTKASEFLMHNKKKRYTENGKVCAPTFTHEGKTYDDCTRVKTPDQQEAAQDWCYIKQDQIDPEAPKIWEYCRPDLNWDKVREYNQEQLQKYHVQAKSAEENLRKLMNDINTTNNTSTNIVSRYQEIDQSMESLFKLFVSNDYAMQNLIDSNSETKQLENLGVKLGTLISIKEGLSGMFSSFLELNIQNPLLTGSPLTATGSNPLYNKVPNSYGSLQSDQDEIVSRDVEAGHMVIAPWLQNRILSETKDGAGMDNYEQDSVGDGLMGRYYDNMNFYGSYYTQKDATPDFDFTGASPAPGINKDNFSVRWSGFILAPHTGEYQFLIESDGGIGLSVNEQLILSKNLINPAADPNKITEYFLLSKIRENNSNSNNPKAVKSLKINLIGGNKYKIVVAYYHTCFSMIKENDPVFIKLFWQSDNFKLKVVERKYLFTENVFDPMKITGISPEIGVIRKLLENDLAFKDQKEFVLTDIPAEFVGLNCLKLNMKYFENNLELQINNPATIYIAFHESYTDPTPADFEETHQILMINEVKAPPKHKWKETTFEAVKSIPFKIKKKAFDAGKISIPINKTGVNSKSVTLVVFYGFDKFNDSPITCGGEEFWISQPTSPFYDNCIASSQDISKARRCEDGLNGEMRDEPHGGSIWSTVGEGIGANMQVIFKDTFQVSRIEYQDRSNSNERTKTLEILFSNGIKKLLSKQNTSDRREFKIDPPVKTHYLKFTVKQTYGTGSVGGAFKIYGYKCRKAYPDDSSPENVGMPYITGTPMPSYANLYDLTINKPIKLSCIDTLDSNKFNPHNVGVGSKILIMCKDSCVTSDEDLKIYGNNTGYSKDSIICKAALHSQILPVDGGTLRMEIGPEKYNIKGKVSSGITSWDKRYSKYTIKFSQFREEEEIIIKEGSSVDLKNPNKEGWLPGKITKIEQTSSARTLHCIVENQGPDDPVIQIQYPNRQKLAPCGEYVPNRNCEGSRRSINKNRPLRWRFTTQDYQGTNDLKDYGGVFGSSGKPYGWSRDMTSRAVRRNTTNDPKLETLIEFPPSKKSLVCNSPSSGVNCEEASWSVKTGPGIYNIKIGVGDVFSATRLDLKINSNYIAKGVTLSKGEYQIFEGSTQAINNFITIKSECIQDCAFAMSKINMLEISPVVNEDGWLKLQANNKPPEKYDACGKSSSGGRCFDSNPTNCLYDEPSSPGTHMCTGSLNLVQVSPQYKCTDQRDKFKCVKRFYKTMALCADVCPKECTPNSFGFMCQ